MQLVLYINEINSTYILEDILNCVVCGCCHLGQHHIMSARTW